MVRVRDEEETLAQSLESLNGLLFPHEIVVILHLCKDRSAEIAAAAAAKNPHIRIHIYDIPISRAGYETLATDAKSRHSLPTYYNWCLSKCKYPWNFKWDADFIATPGLWRFLNSRTWHPADEIVRISAINEDSNNKEPYLVGHLVHYAKFKFWEIPMYVPRIKTYAPEDAIIQHASTLKTIKSYWNEPPWFETEETEEAATVRERMRRLTEDIGKEPKGLARASNPECDGFLNKLANLNYVHFTE